MKRAKKKANWVPWAFGIGGAGLVAYLLLRPKTASAAESGGQKTPPPPVVPGPGNIQIDKGSSVTLIAPLKARYGGDYVNVPSGTVLYVEHLDPDGTIWFRYNGQLLSSPVEDYSDKIAG
jgi:hypothetical protein